MRQSETESEISYNVCNPNFKSGLVLSRPPNPRLSHDQDQSVPRPRQDQDQGEARLSQDQDQTNQSLINKLHSVYYLV